MVTTTDMIGIIDRLHELEAEAQAKVDVMHELKAAYHNGYRYVDSNDTPVGDQSNVVTFPKAKVR
jgi:hypothetical protein